MSVIKVERKILEKNDAIAQQLRAYFTEKKIFAVNLLSSPGSGKTSLIEQTVKNSRSLFKTAVIVGDLQTDNDAQRIAALSIPVVQIITNGSCHLEANLVRDAFQNLNENFDLLFIENVGNLVCPAGFDLGEHLKVVVASTTEGDDKPLKYPAAYRNSSALVINKIDLIPHINSDPEAIKKNALLINNRLEIFEVSCTTNQGIESWTDWLHSKIKQS
ncbi:MAG: hydrogenase accessory protein HypB [Ignavibacteriales bacterium]|nr:MAG: hydrogenase accessory protein HypB [Ignavibacteriales bacterium]